MEPARPRDALATLALHRAVLQEGRWFVATADEAVGSLTVREALIRRSAGSDSSAFWVARHPHDGVVGTLTAMGGVLQRCRHVASIEMMVAAESRGQGTGRALLAAAIAWAEANPVLSRLTLAVFADNARAISLYESVGFVEEGRRVGEYREPDGSLRDDVLMARRVGGRWGSASV